MSLALGCNSLGHAAEPILSIGFKGRIQGSPSLDALLKVW